MKNLVSNEKDASALAPEIKKVTDLNKGNESMSEKAKTIINGINDSLQQLYKSTFGKISGPTFH